MKLVGPLYFFASAIAAMAMLATPARAGFPVEIETVCPIGGETFTFVSTGSYSTYGARPDGKPYGSWSFPLAIPECPENLLVMYRQFNETEISSLTELVLSKDYKALRNETTYYRAAWLAERMDKDNPLSSVWLLMRAGWQVDHKPETKARYQREFAERAMRVAVLAEDTDTLFLRYRLANIYRELGQFSEATAMLDTIPMQALDVTVPEGDDVPYEQQREAESLLFLKQRIGLMRGAIERSDKSAEPPSLIGEEIASRVCLDLLEAQAQITDPLCSTPAMLEKIEELRKRRAERETLN